MDTPGVGEVTMGDLLLEYVAKRDVFGFIFVIKCDDSGGVLQRVNQFSYFSRSNQHIYWLPWVTLLKERRRRSDILWWRIYKREDAGDHIHADRFIYYVNFAAMNSEIPCYIGNMAFIWRDRGSPLLEIF